MTGKNLKKELAQEDAERESYDFSEGRRGPVIDPGDKVSISLYLDSDVIQWFKDQLKGGGSYQTLINQALRDHINGRELVELVRSAVREELAGLKAG